MPGAMGRNKEGIPLGGLSNRQCTVARPPSRRSLEALAFESWPGSLGAILMKLPLSPPYPPMEARSVDSIPSGPEWQYEPKWDGFRCLAFREGNVVELQSKSGQPLARYFPDIVASLQALRPKKFVLDGEIVIPVKGELSFDELLLRIHPAASRVSKLAKEHPGVFIVFDVLVNESGKSLVKAIAGRSTAMS